MIMIIEQTSQKIKNYLIYSNWLSVVFTTAFSVHFCIVSTNLLKIMLVTWQLLFLAHTSLSWTIELLQTYQTITKYNYDHYKKWVQEIKLYMHTRMYNTTWTSVFHSRHMWVVKRKLRILSISTISVFIISQTLILTITILEKPAWQNKANAYYSKSNTE